MKDALIKCNGLTFWSFARCVVMLISMSVVPASLAGQSDEVDVTVNGKLKIVQIDHDPGAMKPDEVLYLLEDEETRKVFTLRFEKKAPRQLRSGMRITARGRSKGQELLLAADGGGSQSITVNSAPAAMVAGDQKTLVIMANLTDASVTCSADSVRDVMFSPNTSVDALYRETSYGAVSFSGQVVGSYNLNYQGSSCNFGAWADAADAVARADGINLSDYSRKVYVMPNTCSVGGIGEVGTNPSRAWVFRCDFPDVFAHEVGHNLGMHHAATPGGAYGDISDIMGGSGRPLRQINAPHKEQMGWVVSAESAIVTSPASYDIAPLELNPLDTALPSSLKIFKPDTNEYYYLSYRRGIGFDANLAVFSYLDRTSVHTWSGAGGTNLVALLSNNESFVDSANGISFNQTSHGVDRATVQVGFSTACTPALPAVTVSPASQNAAPGGTLQYTISVTNADGPQCAQSVFDLRHSVPFSWIGSVAPSSLALLPGASGQATLSVTSPAGVPTGSYTVGVDLSAASPTRTVSGSGTYSVVLQADTSPPTAPGGLSATVRRKGVTLTWNPSQDNVGVTGYKVFRNGALMGTTGSLSYSDGLTSSGVVYQYVVKATDAAANLSAASNMAAVTIGGGTSGGGGKGGSKP